MSKQLIDAQSAQSFYLQKFEEFAAGLNGDSKTAFHQVRLNALEHFRRLGFPGRKDEEWKYTNVTPLLRHTFGDLQPGNVDRSLVEKLAFPSGLGNLVVMVNGQLAPELSNYQAEGGLIVENLSTAMKNHAGLVEKHFSRYANYEQESFTALNTAFAANGLFVYVPANLEVETPLYVLHISQPGEQGFFANPRNLIIAEKNSRIKIVESFRADGDHPYFNNVVTEAWVDTHARVDHVRLQDESTGAFHIFNMQARQEAESFYSLTNLDIGGGLVRNNLNIELDGPHGEGHLIGFYMGTGTQHIDNHTLIDHAQPNCESNELYKGILSGKAQGVFNGKIFVRQDAQKTNAYQDNKALLLSDEAIVNTKPQLEIFADDVRCSHGATVGQLDEEAIFYLRARGIPEETANSILQYAFASDVFQYIPIEELRSEVDEIILERFQQL